MPLKKIFCRREHLGFYLLLAFFLFATPTSQAQCAGTDATLTVCNVADPANQNISLFNLLGPTATPGGSWSDPTQSGALNLVTGVLNVWNVHLSGTITYTYTVNSPGCADNNATVTVTVGGYSGVPSPNGSACSDDTSVNLFQFFVGGNVPAPQFNGAWTDNNNTGALNGSMLDATASGLGTFSFTYSMAAVGSCPAMQSTVNVTVYRAPDPGQGGGIALCETDDMSPYTNVNLFDHLSGEDANGLWSENGTSELSGMFDSTIDVQHIFATHGPGTYNFMYTVYPTNPVCQPKSSSVVITIEKVLDLTGATFTVNSDICESEMATATYSGVLTEGIMPVPDADYELKLHVSSASVNGNFSVTGSFVNGVMVFPISNVLFQQVGAYTVTVIGIKKAVGISVCDNIVNAPDVLNIFPNPKIDSAILAINPVCLGSAATVQISGIGNLADGNYQITYNLGGANNTIGQQLNMSVANGAASFQIPASLLTNAGNTAVIITNVLNLQTGCFKAANKSQNFTINPLPDAASLQITIANSCEDQQASVLVSGLGVMNSVTITYDLSGANAATGQTATFTAVTGAGVFSVPGSLLGNSGMTTLTITSLTNNQTGCSAPASKSTTFEVYAAPDLTTVAVAINDVCKGQPVGVSLSGLGSVTSITMVYSLSGANNVAGQSVNLAVNSGNASFNLPAALVSNTGNTVFHIVSIATQPTGCLVPFSLTEDFTINPIPEVSNFILTIPNACSGQPVSVFLSQLGNAPTLSITYSLSGANTATGQAQALTLVSGSATFVIPSSLLANTGITTLTITGASDPAGNCAVPANLSKNFGISPLLDVSSLAASIADVCVGKPVTVQISGLANASSVTIGYNLSGANAATGQTATVNLTNGSGSFAVPSGLLPATGTTTLTITDIVNAQTSCATPLVNLSDDFTIFLLPDAPTAANATFCALQDPTVADLSPAGPQYNWYDSATATTPLSLATALASGTYYVTQTNASNCESAKTLVAVSLTELAAPTLNADGQLFCGADNPTIQNLTANANAPEGIIWFDAASGGNQLASDVLLQEGATYYGFQFSDTLGCTSAGFLQVTVALTECDDDPTHYDFFVPDGFSPNGDAINDTFRIPDIEFLYPDFKLEIYNRYGNLLFTGNINKPYWDGKNAEAGPSGEIAPNGVYFYIVHFNKNNRPAKQGRLYLNR